MLDPQQLAVRYEPQVDLVSGVLVGVQAIACAQGEGLLESRVSTHTVSQPGGLAIPVGEWTLRHACLEVGRWHREGAGRFRLMVKVCARELHHESYVENVRAILGESGLHAGYVEIELQEAAAVTHADTIGDTLRRLKQLGVRLALGAFGTTRCSLTMLRQLACDRLKIHPSFLRVTGAHNRLPVARAIIELGRTLRMSVIAEGIETRRAIDLLSEYGCKDGQGPYFGSALPSQVFAAGLWVAATKAGVWTVPAPWISTKASRIPLIP